MRRDELHETPTPTMSVEEMWDKLIDLGVSEDTLQVVSNINGYRTDVMEDILYATSGYRSFGQLEDDD